MLSLQRTWLTVLCALLVGPAALGAPPASAPTSAPAAPSALYQLLVGEYLDGKWDELEANLAKNTKELASLDAGEKADVAYIRLALAECRPAWWKQCKAGQKVQFRPVVWTRTLNATFDPAGQGLHWRSENGVVKMTVSWNAKDMDDPEHAEHGFSKGEVCDLGVWMALGMGEGWAGIPIQAQMNLTDEKKLLAQRYLDFRSNLTGAYYGIPRARRWGLWLFTAGYMEQYAKQPTIMARRSVAAMFVAEVVGHPGKYPSIKLPEELPLDGAEEKLALALKDWIETHPWTVAEDKAIRDAFKAFATANGPAVYLTGKVTLPNGQAVALDPQADEAKRPRRDAWVKEQFDKAGK